MKTVIVFVTLMFSLVHVLAQDVSGTTKTYYFKDKVVSTEKYLDSEQKLDSVKRFYKTGRLNEAFYFNEGKLNGKSYKYDPTGNILTTWTYSNGTLLNRVDHKPQFNKKNETKVKMALQEITAINKNNNYNPKTFKDILSRANARQVLNNQTLALHDYIVLTKSFKKNNVPPKLKSLIYDKLSSIYASFELNTHAIHYRLKAIKSSPKDTRLLYNFAADLYRAKAYRLAIHYLNEVKKTWETHAFSNWLLAQIYSDLDQNERALKFVNLAIEREANINKYSLNTSENDLRTIRGILYHKLGESEKGIQDLKEALRINENNSLALRHLGVIYHDLGDFKTSCELLNKANELGYEKIHDKTDLQYYLEQACEQKTELKLELIAKKPFAYPNPATNLITVKNVSLANFNFELYNFESKLVQKGNANKFSINISNLSSGLYILRLIDYNTAHTLKIIKK